MIVVLGLGNPGSRYEQTRHNVGFRAVSEAAAFFQVKLKKRCFRLYRQARVNGQALLVQPLTYMNASGDIMDSFSKDDDFVVVCDNMDLAAGGLRIRKGGGASGQKGLASISEKLGRSDFVRIYIGIGRPEEGVSVPDHVLGVDAPGERKDAVDKAVSDAAKAIEKYISGATVEELQLEFNRKGIL
ncbi:MAG: aminoacyl-tRNA hydrolase [Spirochaetales bacterium]|nr:aminoacyl-tRNA hydrolase [Spirochaetales bacterium]